MDKLVIADKEFSSRLFIGTGKFPSNRIMGQAILSSGTQMVTTALKRIDVENSKEDDMLRYIPRDKVVLLPNTSGVRTAEEAIFAAKMSKAALGTNWIKLEIHPDPKHLLPDTTETIKATEELVKLGFIVLPFVQADPIACKQLEQAGAATVMPLASPIGTNQGIRNKELLEIIISQSNVPVVIDAGLGSPSDAAKAMELGASAVLVNTAISIASNPIAMAEAFNKAVEAGRLAYLSGLANQSSFARATSPLTAFLDEEQKNVDKL
ncbi:MAG: thiazole synthase [Bacteroidales bacterium]|jgi:thiazole synthase|nr:thiazole synthase [Bacteroidales bacterium]